jgi:hypothetical protein
MAERFALHATARPASEPLAAEIARFAQKDGDHATAIPALSLHRRSTPTEPLHCIYNLGLGVVAQGDKQVMLGAESIDFMDIVFGLEEIFGVIVPSERLWAGAQNIDTNDPSQDGVVLTQTPGAGESAKPGDTVTITVGHYVAPPPTTTQQQVTTTAPVTTLTAPTITTDQTTTTTP